MRTGGCCRFDDVDDSTLLFLMKARTNVFVVVGDVNLQFDGIVRKNLVVAATGGDDNDHHHRCWCCYYCYEDDHRRRHYHHQRYCFHTG